MPDALQCPSCHTPLEAFALDRATTLDTCPRCRGTWFDRGELARAIGTPRDLVDPPPEDLPLAAPDAPTCLRCPGVCMLRVPFAVRGDAPSLDWCPQCEGLWTSLPAVAAMRRFVVSTAPKRPAFAAPSPSPSPAPALSPKDFVYDDGLRDELSLRQAAAAFPIAAVVVAVVRSFLLGRILMQGARVSLHELGHATVAWACGWKALPLPVGFTFTTPGRHPLMHLLVLAACGAGGAWAFRRRAWGFVAFCGLYALAALVGTWALSPERQDMLVTWGGCAGEMWLGGALVALAHQNVPAWPRWQRIRWIALALGACAFVDASLFWRAASRDHELIPWGSALADNGDMDILHDRYGWSESALTGRYVTLSWWVLLMVLTAQGIAVWRAWRRRGETA